MRCCVYLDAGFPNTLNLHLQQNTTRAGDSGQVRTGVTPVSADGPRPHRTIGFPCGYRVQMRHSHSIESVIRDIDTHRNSTGVPGGEDLKKRSLERRRPHTDPRAPANQAPTNGNTQRQHPHVKRAQTPSQTPESQSVPPETEQSPTQSRGAPRGSTAAERPSASLTSRATALCTATLRR